MAVQRSLATPRAAELARAYSQGPGALRRSWVLATTLGETVGFVFPALVGTLAFDLYPAFTLLVMVVAGSLEGATLGAAQSVVLSREFLGFSRSAWVGATSSGAAAAWFIAMLPSTFYGLWADWPLAVLVPVAAILGFLFLGTIGFAQWTVLRHHVARSRTWVPANAAAWTLALGAFSAMAMPLWHEGQSTGSVIAIGVAAGLLMAVTAALVTGIWLSRLVHPRSRAVRSRSVPAGVPAADWAALSRPTDRFGVFDPTALDDLPEPVQRWLRHAITPGAALLTGVDAEWNGHIRLGRAWRKFYSRQRATMDGGFVWAAHTRLAGLPLTGFDRFTRDEGQMRWRLLRRITVVSDDGEQTTRSAAGRHAMELLAAVPAVSLDPRVEWEPVDHRRATARFLVGDEEQAVTVSIDPLGRLRQLEMDRWGTPPGSGFDRYRFGVLLGEERRFDGYLVPTEVVGGWYIGTGRWDEGVFMRFRVVRCSFH